MLKASIRIVKYLWRIGDDTRSSFFNLHLSFQRLFIQTAFDRRLRGGKVVSLAEIR